MSRILDLLDTSGRAVSSILIPDDEVEIVWNFYTAPILLGGIKLRKPKEKSDD